MCDAECALWCCLIRLHVQASWDCDTAHVLCSGAGPIIQARKGPAAHHYSELEPAIGVVTHICGGTD